MHIWPCSDAIGYVTWHLDEKPGLLKMNHRISHLIWCYLHNRTKCRRSAISHPKIQEQKLIHLCYHIRLNNI